MRRFSRGGGKRVRGSAAKLIKRALLLALLDVPDFHQVVRGRGGQHVLRRRVELRVRGLALVADQVDQRLRDVFRDAALGDAPHLDRAVLAGARDDVLVERVEVEVEHLALVPLDHGEVGRLLAGLLVRDDGERAHAAVRHREKLAVALDVVVVARGCAGGKRAGGERGA